MGPKGKPGLAILLGHPGMDDDKDEKKSSHSDEQLSDIAQELMDALKDDDKDGVSAALKAFFSMCDDDDYEEDKDEEEG